MDSAGAPNPVKPSTSRCAGPLSLFVVVCFLVVGAFAQPPAGGRGGGGRGAAKGGRGPQNAKASAPIDVSGYWVSVVTEDWRYRMVTPPKGNFLGVPLTGQGRTVANAWDPAKDEADGLQCKSYGAAAIMRVPGRFHFTWVDDNTLKIDIDSGMQTRLLHFGGTAPADTQPSWQGSSIAQWEAATTGKGQPKAGDLRVVTTHMLPGYVRKNGVPYSGDAVLTEFYDRIVGPNGDDWLVVTSEVKDPMYFTMPFTTTTHFKKMKDDIGWDPQPCSSR